MKRLTKKVIVLSMSFLIIGGILTLIGWMLGGRGVGLGWDGPRRLYEERTGWTVDAAEDGGERHTGGELNLGEIHTISVDVDFADVRVETADAFGVDLEWYGTLTPLSYRGENGTLSVWNEEARGGYFHSDAQSGTVTLYIPQGITLESLSLTTDSGDILVGENVALTASAIHLDTDYGDIFAHDLAGGKMTIQLDAGDFEGARLTAESLIYHNDYGQSTFRDCDLTRLEAEGDSGDLLFDSCVFGFGDLSADYGNIFANNLESQGLEVSNDNGDVEIMGLLRGRNTIEVDYGEVTLTTSLPQDQYAYDLYTDYGTVYLDGEAARGAVSQRQPGASDSLRVENESGDIHVNFAQ